MNKTIGSTLDHGRSAYEAGEETTHSVVLELRDIRIVESRRSVLGQFEVFGQLLWREALEVRLQELLRLDVEDGRPVEEQERVLEELDCQGRTSVI
jgi:hypothetical protein